MTNIPCCISYDNTTYWRLDGKLHRIDGPAVEYSDDHKEWWVNGKLHRSCGPAIEYPENDPRLARQEWWVDGRRHRIDGPAIMWNNGDKEWWIYGKRINIQLILRAISQVKRWCFKRRIIRGMQKARLLRELRFLPPSLNFPGGIEYQSIFSSFKISSSIISMINSQAG